MPNPFARTRRVAAAVLTLVLAAASPGAAQDRTAPVSRSEITLSFAPVVKRAAPAVVNIYARKQVAGGGGPFANDPFFSQLFGNILPLGRRMEDSLGSGVIVRPDGLVVSNHHVVGGADEIRVVLTDRREFDAEVLLTDEKSDLSVLRLKGAADLPALSMRDSDEMEVGDLVLAIGNPFGVGQTVTSGIVSGLARTGIKGQGYFIQTDAAINPGNSGGALVDVAGRLVGINTAILSRSGGSNGIGFAIPSNLVRQVVMQAEAGRTRLARPWSGIVGQPVDDALAEGLGLDRPMGVVVAGTHRLSPFAKAGIRTGDVVIALDGHPVQSPAEFAFRLSSLGVGAKTRVTFMRKGKTRKATVRLIAAPEDPPREALRLGGRGPLRGLVVANLSPALAEEIGAPPTADGVVVLDAPEGARRLGFRPGDVIRGVNEDRVERTGDLDAAARKRVRSWRIEVERGGRRGTLTFRG